jgi:DNA-binding transcriptional MocR family regulator
MQGNMNQDFLHWKLRLPLSGLPAYQAIPALIRDDLRSGRLAAGDRLPPLRTLADLLGLDYTTVTRGYAEARRLGLVDSAPGRGTTVRSALPRRSARPVSPLEMTMNMPPESRDPALLNRLQSGLEFLGHLADPHALLRYQEFGGSPEDREVAADWLRPCVPGVLAEQVLVTPGIQGTLSSLFALLAPAGEVILAEPISYPGVKAIAAQLGIRVAPVACDENGPLPAALDSACRELKPRLLYLNPTLSNPTVRTLPLQRREALADVALRHALPIVEDDAYGMLPRTPLPTFARLVPETTWYLTGLAKCLGAGLRLGFLVAPDSSRRRLAASALRTASIMASPISCALASHWIQDGTAALILAAVRSETLARQRLAVELLPADALGTDPDAFHCWLLLPAGLNRLTAAAQLRAAGMAAVASDTFTIEGPPPNAVRLCLGGAVDIGDCRQGLQRVADLLRDASALPLAG